MLVLLTDAETLPAVSTVKSLVSIESPDSENETNAPGDETEDDENDADEEDESGEWIEYEVEDRTFDLTQLQGDNASLLQQFDAPEGSYTKVFVHVEEINGTLDNGESVNVKLPSERLQINQGFTVESNETIDFVFDITVHKAGNSGKYILTPVISESGTDVPIEDVDEDREENGEDEREEDEADDREDDTDDEESEDQGTIEGEEGDVETALDAAFVGTVEPGENTTVRVTANDSAVANASVVLDDEVVAITDETGQATFGVPEDADELEVGIEAGEAETELEAAFEDAPPA